MAALAGKECRWRVATCKCIAQWGDYMCLQQHTVCRKHATKEDNHNAGLVTWAVKY